MKKKRKQYSAEEKVAILKRHLVDNITVSDLCDEHDVEIILQRAKERYPQATPRIISGNGPQFIARDFKEYIRLMGMTYVRTSPFYPQSNGKLERWHKSLKQEVIRSKVPRSLEDARRLVGEYVSYYNTGRLHSAIGYITRRDKIEGRAQAIFEDRREKLARAQTLREQCCEVKKAEAA